jgi:hypothetical protein
MRLLFWSALASLFLASPAALAERPTPVRPDVIEVLGQKWCIGKVPDPSVCDLHLVPDAVRPSEARPARSERWLQRLVEEVRQRAKREKGRNAQIEE